MTKATQKTKTTQKTKAKPTGVSPFGLPGGGMTTGLSPMQFRDRYGLAITQGVCIKAGTTYDYFKHICNQRKRPGVDLARRLVAASGGRLDLDKLLIPKTMLRKSGEPPMNVPAMAPVTLAEIHA